MLSAAEIWLFTKKQTEKGRLGREAEIRNRPLVGRCPSTDCAAHMRRIEREYGELPFRDVTSQDLEKWRARLEGQRSNVKWDPKASCVHFRVPSPYRGNAIVARPRQSLMMAGTRNFPVNGADAVRLSPGAKGEAAANISQR